MESRCRIQAGLYPGGRRPWLALDVFEGGSAVLEKGIRSKRIAAEGLKILLENECPGKQREHQQDDQNGARDPTGLLKQVPQLTCEQENCQRWNF